MLKQCRVSSERQSNAAKVGRTRPAAQPAAQTIGAAAAVAAKASSLSQPPGPKLSIGTVSSVQPNNTAGSNTKTATRRHKNGAAALPRARHALAKANAASSIPATACAGQCGWSDTMPLKLNFGACVA